MVWDLSWEGARKIKGGKIDTGDPAAGPRAVPGAYTVRLTVDGQTKTVPVKIVADPRGSLPQADLEAQLTFALRVRDAISKLTGLVNQVRSVREQLQARTKALDERKSESGVADLVKTSEAAVSRATALENRLHNPTADIVYDILAMRGGTKLYSRLAPLQMWAVESDGVPTAGMLDVLAAQEKELADLERETTAFIGKDVAGINAAASRLGIAFVVTK